MNCEIKSEVFNMDCLEYMKTLPDNCFDLCIADPPYGINRSGQRKTVCKNKKHNRKFFEKKDWDLDIPCEDIFKEMFRVSKNQIIWGANYFTRYLPKSMGWIVWDKGQHGLTMSDGELAFTSFERALRINVINRCKLAIEGTIHPTQKPIALYHWVLKNYAKKGDKIFDPFLGSGSSRIAAYKMGFDFVGCEIDEEYFRLSEERFQRECKGVEVMKNGMKLVQKSLF